MEQFRHFCLSFSPTMSTNTMAFTLRYPSYNELFLKNRFKSVPIAALCLYNIQRENLVFKILSVIQESADISAVWYTNLNGMIVIPPSIFYTYISLLCIVKWIYKRRMRNISSFIYDFGMARFV